MAWAEFRWRRLSFGGDGRSDRLAHFHAVAGYSPRSLSDKLGIKAGARVVLLNPPEGFEDVLAPLPDSVKISRRLSAGADLVVAFFVRRADLARTWSRG